LSVNNGHSCRKPTRFHQGGRVTQTAKILVVEDDPNMLSALCSVLETQGYAVVSANCAEDAMTLSAAQHFDLIVTDIRMGEVDGLQALEKARQVQPEVGALVVSGYASEEETLRAVQLNVGGYLKKPFKMRDFLEQVESILERRRVEMLRSQEKASTRRALLSCYESLLQVIDMTGCVAPQGQLWRLPDLVFGMATAANLAGDLPAQLRLGLALRACSHLGPLQNQDFLEGLRASSVGVHRIVTQGKLSELSEAIENQLLDYARDNPEGGEPKDEALRALHQKASTREPGSGNPASSVVTHHVSQASLLHLARTLERAGDGFNARRAYEEMCKYPLPPGEEIEAQMGLARLALGEGETSRVSALFERARQLAVGLNPAAQAHLTLEQGRWLSEMSSPQALQQLQLAQRQYEVLELEAGSAEARLAVGLLQGHNQLEGPLQVLLRPECRAELTHASEWLLSMALERQAQPKDLLRAWVHRSSLELGRRWGQLSDAAKAHLLSLFEESQQGLPEELLKPAQDDADPQIRACAARLAGTSDHPNTLLEIHSLGFFEVFTGSRRIPESEWKTQKVKFLLAYLASQEAATEDQLIELFWPDSLNSAKKSLNHALSTLRSGLRAGLGQEPIVRERGVVRLNPQVPLWHDLSELESAWNSARQQSEGEARLPGYRRVVSLYRGPYLEGCYADWGLNRRKDLESRVAEAAFQIANCALASENPHEAVEFSNRALALDPTRQDVLCVSLRGHILAGRPAAAVAQYEQYAKWLKQEFEAEPTIEVMREYHRARLGIT
jgi:two-component SAPR family response regulator